MITTDGDGIEFWHVPGRKFENISNDFHRRRRRIDIGVSYHELLQDVILYCTIQVGQRDALFFRCNNIKCKYRKNRAIHSHRDRHFSKRDLVKKDLHILHAINGNPGFTDIPENPGVIGVITAMSRKVKSDR